MQLKANYTKIYLLVVFLCVAFKGIAQFKKVNINLENTALYNALDYKLDTIENVSASFAHFYDTVIFFNAPFSKSANFLYTIFSKYVDFSAATFSDVADFQYATFSENVGFFDTKFLGFALFSNSAFIKNAEFGAARFSIYTDFSRAIFSKDADFSRATFSKDADFSYATFSKKLSLNSLKISDSTEFHFVTTTLPDTLDFSDNSKIYNEVDFTTADFTDSSRYDYKAKTVKPTLIYLYQTDISKLHLDYVHYRLLLPDSTLKNKYAIKRIISKDEKESMYEQLLNNFKTYGQLESYELCDIEYQTFKWNHSRASFLPCVPYYWNHFGYDKQMIFPWTFGFIFCFTIITCILLNYLNTQVYKVENIPPSFKNFGNRLWFSFIYTSTVFFRLTLKIEKINFERKWGTVYLILMYTIGLVCLAYMANFVLQK